MKQIDACLANRTRQVDERPAQIGRHETMYGPILKTPWQLLLPKRSEQNYVALRRDPGEGVKEPTRISSNAARRRGQAPAIEPDQHVRIRDRGATGRLTSSSGSAIVFT
jgi:hypothetical protein